ncbi:MAG TPA: peroxide stress protein YaaA [Nocardioides sp.]|uniref:YaaA family protein n=1 Tax=Nocardioides sp. TaxID=35761 RepID=UPI002E37362C|nr:peroxide stress protein YaaA [Nocardioides sp.]HEX3932813.1 peroxide stress protein YaaA [Nocardioides sp.]
MLILLPPSEGKAHPRRGRPLSLGGGPLDEARRLALDALVDLCRGPGPAAARVLGLGAGQVDDVGRNARIWSLPTAPAERIYTGVLYDALGLTTLTASAHRRALARLATVSSVYGLVGPGERIAPYRLAGDVTLPGLGGVAAHWRRHLGPLVRDRAGRGLVVDLRSTTYAAFWRPAPDLAPRVVTVRVLHEVGGKRQVVSHFNKATKGRLVRAILEDGRDARTPTAFAGLLSDLGWHVELGTAGRSGTPLDVVVREL